MASGGTRSIRTSGESGFSRRWASPRRFTWPSSIPPTRSPQVSKTQDVFARLQTAIPFGMAVRIRLVSLPMEPGANPESAEDVQRNDENNHAGREADVKISVGVVHCMMAEEIPCQQRKDSDGRCREEGEERRGKCQQQALKQAEALEWKSQEFATRMALALRGLHRRDLRRLEYSLMPSGAQIELWPADKVAAQA